MWTALLHTPAAVALALAALGVLAAVRLGAAFDAALALVAGALVVLRLPAGLAPAATLVSALALAMLTKPKACLSVLSNAHSDPIAMFCERWADFPQWASKSAWASQIVVGLTDFCVKD